MLKIDHKKIIDKINQRISFESLDKIDGVVKEIINAVIKRGDEALQEFSKKFDSHEVDINSKNPFGVDLRQNKYFSQLESGLQKAIETASKRIREFHKHETKYLETQGWSFSGPLDEKLGVKINAIDSVAVYIPGGSAPLLSTVMMTVIPAQAAGVKRIAIFSPPPINHKILAVAEYLGVDEVYSLGGAQAVATATFGTQSIRRFDKIVGPGNIYVTQAKKILNGFIGIDGIYGPSELAILCDETAKPQMLALDLLSQLEHGSGLESVLLVSTDEEIINATSKAINDELEALGYSPKLKDTISNSLKNWSAFIKVDSLEEAIDLINYYAPEHLEVQLAKEHLKSTLSHITNAGAIFIGANSCESLGDYIAGPSHCLPTAGSARFSSGLKVADFFKKTSIIDFSSANNSSQFKNLLKDVATLARGEMLEAHARAAEARL